MSYAQPTLTLTLRSSQRCGFSVSASLLMVVTVTISAPYTTEASGDRNQVAAQCDWKVHYDTWLPSFDPVPYEHPGYGEHCLEVCCHDPDCKGLALDSSDKWTCFRYTKLPSKDELVKHPSKPLGDGIWLLNQKQAWSVFEKEAASPDSPRFHPFVHHALSWSRRGIHHRGEAPPHASMVVRAPRHSDNCKWDVYYDLWEPSFDKSEYRSPAGGGMHCLEACCKDPTCHGIQMESIELFQCYKYSTSPNLHGRHGQFLADSRWLLHKSKAWSVFMKAGVLPAGAPGAGQREVALNQHLRFTMATGKHAPHGPFVHHFFPGKPPALKPWQPHGHGLLHHQHVHQEVHPVSHQGYRRAMQRTNAAVLSTDSQQQLGQEGSWHKLVPAAGPVAVGQLASASTNVSLASNLEVSRHELVPTAGPAAAGQSTSASTNASLASHQAAPQDHFTSSMVLPWIVQLMGVLFVIGFFFQRTGMSVLVSVALRDLVERGPKAQKASCGNYELVDRSLL